MNRLKEGRMGMGKLSVDTVFTSEKIENIIAFGYCYLMLEYKNAAVFAFLSSGLRVVSYSKANN